MIFAAYKNQPFALKVAQEVTYSDARRHILLALEEGELPPNEAVVFLTASSRRCAPYHRPIRVIDPERDQVLLRNIPPYAEPAWAHIALWNTTFNHCFKRSLTRVPRFLVRVSELRGIAA